MATAESTNKVKDDTANQKRRNAAEYDGLIAAIHRSQAVVELGLDGTILTANENYLQAIGYSLEEIQGRHHSMLVGPAEARSSAYQEFWERLNQGEAQSGEFRRIGKGSRELWLQATYSPVLNKDNKPLKVVSLAVDVTAQKVSAADSQGQIEAINNSLAVVEFEMDGTILTANDIFLQVMGYQLAEVQGRHHSMFVEPAARKSAEYRGLWDRLNRGEYQSAEVKRIGKGGKEVWIQAAYNPILDVTGNPHKVVKYATDVTEQKIKAAEHEGQLAAINKSQGVVEFDLSGTILQANDNFLQAVGYSLSEVQGRHHSMFVDPDYKNSGQYQEFWARLSRGEYQAGEYKRIGKGGKEVWIQASYNPVLDLNGKPCKIVKYATDVTQRVELQQTAAKEQSKTEELLEQVIGSAQQFTESSKVIAESAANLSDGAQTQAASVEEMTAAIDELTSAIQVISQSSSDSKDQADQTASMAKDGGQTVKEAVNAMRLIEKSSEQITDIIQVISEIASQTNLLALNAAIEAARAGEHGLGFAVVADEVRKLAERASEAAKEITQLIKESSRRVAEGAQLSEKVGQSLMAIVEAVDATATGIAQIAEQAEAQSASAHQVQSAIKSVSDTTESGAASAEELAASAEELGAQAQSLQDLVTQFRN